MKTIFALARTTVVGFVCASFLVACNTEKTASKKKTEEPAAASHGDQILLSAPSADTGYYGMYSPNGIAASFKLASRYYVSTIEVALRTPASTSFTTFHFSLQNQLTNPIIIFASQDLQAPLGAASTVVLRVNRTLPPGAYYLVGIVPGYAGTPATPGDVDGWIKSTGVYKGVAGAIADGVWFDGKPPVFESGGVYVSPAFTVKGSVVL